MKRDGKKKPDRTSLEIEKTSTPSDVDRLDLDLVSYVDHFITHDLEIGPLEPLSLLSPEEALAALDQIDRTQLLVKDQLKKIQALKRLLST